MFVALSVGVQVSQSPSQPSYVGLRPTNRGPEVRGHLVELALPVVTLDESRLQAVGGAVGPRQVLERDLVVLGLRLDGPQSPVSR